MKVTHCILALLAMIGIAAALLDRVVPHAPRTPIGAVDRIVAHKLPKKGQLAPDSNTTSLIADGINPIAIDPAGQPRSSLAALIAGKGLPCMRVLRATPVDVGNGIYAIDCAPGGRRGGGEIRYRVDTRFGTVSRA